MKINFWGVRGSFPVAANHAAGYGGNTPCVEVTAAGQTILIDAGTGIRAAGKSLTERGVEQMDLLLSHAHWDHIQGFPFFAPLQHEGVTIRIHALRRRDQSLADIFAGQQRPPFCEPSVDDRTAELHFIEHDDGDSFAIGDVGVTCCRLNHPGVSCGYRVEADQKVFAYICDTDLEGQTLHADELPGGNNQAHWLAHLRRNARELGHSADLMVCDTFFLPEEYDPLWGHSCPDEFLRLATEVKASRLSLFHHRPGRGDEDLDEIVERYRPAAVAAGLELDAAREGHQITL